MQGSVEDTQKKADQIRLGLMDEFPQRAVLGTRVLLPSAWPTNEQQSKIAGDGD